MILYLASIDNAIEGEVACETLREAREIRDPGTKVRKISTGPLRGRKLGAALFNRQSFAATQEELD